MKNHSVLDLKMTFRVRSHKVALSGVLHSQYIKRSGSGYEIKRQEGKEISCSRYMCTLLV